MGAGDAASHCKYRRHELVTPKHKLIGKDEYNGTHSKYPTAHTSTASIQSWLAASLCLNALFLSALLSFSAPASFLARQALDSKGHSSVNGHVQRDDRPCSGNGDYEYEGANERRCCCHACFTGAICSEVMENCTVNFDHGDPKVFEKYWSSSPNSVSTVILAGDRMSYFSNTDAICWFLEPALATEIKLIHKMVGNAVTKDFHIVVGTGSSQLISAALYALSSSSHERPVDVVSAVPFYSSYPPMADFLKSQLHRWAGDATNYKPDSQNLYIELVTSPGNPDGMLHTAVVNGTGSVIHDLAYYWPHYTPISFAANYDVMLFTVSKSTGHAGTRIGWALIRSAEVARKMTKYIELSTIGVSKDSQLRASQILRAVRISYSLTMSQNLEGYENILKMGIFDFGYQQMSLRWEQIRSAVSNERCFSLEKFPSGFCKFFEKETTTHPAFAWLRCEKDEDCRDIFKANGILTRSGFHFGSSPKYVRISMVDHDKVFELFIDRLQRMADSCSSR